jgi:hypothetical protein
MEGHCTQISDPFDLLHIAPGRCREAHILVAANIPPESIKELAPQMLPLLER